MGENALEDQQTILVVDIPGFLQIYGDGFISRFDHRLWPVSPDNPVDGVLTKDLVIDTEKGISARIFLPADTPADQKLPVVFYFHGGGFCVGSSAWEGFHVFLSGLASRARVLVVSVDYRFAPEHRIPAAYEDCYESVIWVASTASAGHDEWLASHADTSAFFLSGESAGGNIAHVLAVMAAQRGLPPNVAIKGIVVIHPFFGSEKRVEQELAAEGDEKAYLEFNDTFWSLALPEGADRDHAACNPRGPGAPDLRHLILPPVLVTVAEHDLLKVRGEMYYEVLKESGKVAELEVAEDLGHAYHVFDPRSPASQLLQDRISRFVRDNLPSHPK